MVNRVPSISITVNGGAMQVPQYTTVAAAILIAGAATRSSITGEPRGPLCGMGTCFECRATVNGAPHQRTCQILCEANMDVWTR